MSQAERRRFVRTLVKLKQQEEFLEKSIETFVTGMKVETDLIRDLTQTRNECSIEGGEVVDAIYRIGSDISDDLETVKSMVGQVQNGKTIDPGELKSKLLSLSTKIKEFDPASQLEIFAAEQKELEQAILDFRVNIHEYEKPNSGLLAAGPRKTTLNRKDCGVIDYDEIEDFDSLVCKTGHTQHWNQEDHLFFLKVRKKNPNIPAMIHSIRKKCPDLTAEEIINHEAWYKIYLNLRERQKTTVKEWRRMKDLEKLGKMRSLKNEDDGLDDKSSRRKSQNKSEGDVNDSVITSDDKSTRTRKPPDPHTQQPDEKKELIKKWKTEKENAKLANEERLRNQAEGTRSWKEQQFLLRNIEIKAALDEYRTKKMQEKSKGQIKNRSCTEIVRTPALVKSFRERDTSYLRKRKKIVNSKHVKKPNVEVNTSPARSRIGSTLLKPTKIWEERCRQKSAPEDGPKAVLYIKNLPRLSIHNWKNQETIISL
ncbi:coiled-coil domain-containing protein 112 [Diachasma alloeum]|uniref:coiled-coil domain-containing protein 112 n=1 Tax=Diachasma alloeum TaxID=454923 RepID=UPI00073828CA|nr:coiled-coil domain-containing protein 112 [Diachasma alloeum]